MTILAAGDLTLGHIGTKVSLRMDDIEVTDTLVGLHIERKPDGRTEVRVGFANVAPAGTYFPSGPGGWFLAHDDSIVKTQ